jgi:oxygen-independent coproporphyrinogen-3 oxidase
VGINRINLGVQATVTNELRTIGRRYNSSTPLQTLEIAKKVGFKNICVDLIYGLEGQTLETWKTSVNTIVAQEPETICAYPLTLRPATGFHHRGYQTLSGKTQFEKYDYFKDKLLEFGYQQETHIRFIKNKQGGYRQKVNHWALENIIGFGAGARSYLWYCDYRNGYSGKNRNRAFYEYLNNIEEMGHGRVDGILIDDNERQRKAIILGLFSLDRAWFRYLFAKEPTEIFPVEFETLLKLGLIVEEDNFIKLTSHGIRHRDLIVKMFFSSRIRQLLDRFNYDD